METSDVRPGDTADSVAKTPVDYVAVFVTAPDEEEGARIARALVEEKLAGCANIIRNVRSIYTWEGKVEDGQEVLLVIKTKGILLAELAKRVKELHSYSVPEVIALPIVAGLQDYLNWLSDVTK